MTNQAIKALKRGRVVPDGVLVIDHGDTPLRDVGEKLVKVMRPTANTGYAGGLLVGIGALSSSASADDVVVCMNNDVRVGRESLQEVAAVLGESDKPTLLGARGGRVDMLTGRARIVDNIVSTWRYRSYIHGSFFALPYRLFSAAPLPLSYFMYWEDVVWSWRLAAQGVRMQIITTAGVDHDDSKAQKSLTSTYYMARNGAHALRHVGGVWGMYWLIANYAREGYHRLVSQKGIVAQALRDARKSNLGGQQYE